MARRSALVACAAALGIVGIAGCGGSGGADLTKDRTPDQILKDAQGAAAGQTQFRVTVEGSAKGVVSTRSARTPAILIRTLGGGIRANGQGTVNGDDATLDFDASLASLPSVQGNVTKVGGRVFVGLLGSDYRIALPEDRVREAHPALLPSGLLTWITSPRVEGRETVDGTETVRMTGQVDLDVVSRDALNVLSRIETGAVRPEDIRRSIPELRRGLTRRSVEMWIGTRDLLPRRVVVTLGLRGRITAFPEISRADVTFDTRFDDYGKSVTITEPATDRTLDLDSLGSILG